MGSLNLILALLGTTLLSIPVEAAYHSNLNYRSPSISHAGLGIAVEKVHKRHALSKRAAPPNLSFTHGVASGDPYTNSVILWTRIAPTAENDNGTTAQTGAVPLYWHGPTSDQIKISTAPICVNWRVATDAALNRVVVKGEAYTSSDIDFTVKVEAAGLQPFTPYYYQFNVCGDSNVKSLVGKTKTTPNKDDTRDLNIKLSVFSCSNLPNGFFNAYGNAARRAFADFTIHLGDYLYETGNNGIGIKAGRLALPNKEIFTLYDYRKRHATYRTDADLLLNHQNTAWIPTWDDHEIGDNQYRDGSSRMNNTEATFIATKGVSVDQRKMNAVRAYFEWMPIRQVDMDDNLRIWRSFSFGNLFDLVMLDTRSYDRSITDVYWNTNYISQIANDVGRSLMGSRQENWFYHQLKDSKKRGSTWRVIGSQIIFASTDFSAATKGATGHPLDSWDGYVANRNRTLKTLYDNNIGNNILLSGDSHANWVSDLAWEGSKAYNPATGVGAIGAEFGGTGVTSTGPAGANANITTAHTFSQNMVNTNPVIQFSETYYRGYYELDISRKQVQAHYYGLPTVTTRNSLDVSIANFTVLSGENHLKRPVGDGKAQSGAFKGNVPVSFTNITYDTKNNTWGVSPGYALMTLTE